MDAMVKHRQFFLRHRRVSGRNNNGFIDFLYASGINILSMGGNQFTYLQFIFTDFALFHQSVVNRLLFNPVKSVLLCRNTGAISLAAFFLLDGIAYG
jgi:hypothetical protein